jgi:hypothetical protein
LNAVKNLSVMAGLYESMGNMGNYAKAELLYQQAIEVYRTALGEHHPDFGTALNNLALLHHLAGNNTATKQLFYRVMEIDRIAFGATSRRQPTAALVAADPDFDLSVGQAHAQSTSEIAGALHRAPSVARDTHR